MKVKNVVKVMNFHSLLRVDKARREAEKYFEVEEELRYMIDSITNNRNIILDKKILRVPDNKPVLNIYVGSDLGFCGSYNYVVNSAIKEDSADKVVIGKKVRMNSIKNVKLNITKTEYMEDPSIVTEFLQTNIKAGNYSKVNVLYNDYKNISNINWLEKRIYPFEFNTDKSVSYNEDYVSENSMEDLLIDMICTYVDYELQITVKNSFASENVMRQNATNESLKKIDEIEEQHSATERKEKMLVASQKNIERYEKRRFRRMREDVC